MPLSDGSWLSQSPTNRISSMMIWPGIFLNRKVPISDLAQLLLMRFLHSISYACSFVAVVLIFNFSGSDSQIHSNSLSIRNYFRVYLIFLCNWNIFSIELASTVFNLWLDIPPLWNWPLLKHWPQMGFRSQTWHQMQLSDSQPFPLYCLVPLCILLGHDWVVGGLFFLLRMGTLHLYIVLELRMSSMLTGQLFTVHTIWSNVLFDG